MKKYSHLLFFFAALPLLFSCKPSVPQDIIQPGDMEDILYDYHIASAVGNQKEENREYNERLYQLAALKKHGVTEAEFDSSLVYYTRHADVLHSIYDNIAKRMGDEAMALGADISELNRYEIAEGDTTDLWPGERSMTFLPIAPYNLMSFEIPIDTSFHAGDRFIFTTQSKFLYQDGMRDGIMQLAMKFTNDSVASRMVHMSGESRYTIDLPNNDSLSIKELRGFIYLTRDQHATLTTLKVMVLKDIRLIRFRAEKKKPQKKPENKDSIKATPAGGSMSRPATGQPESVATPDKGSRRVAVPEPEPDNR